MAVAVVIAAPPAPATVPDQPVAKWAVDYGETQCLAIRRYGDAKKPTLLAIRPAPNGTSYELMLTSRTPGAEFAEEHKGSVDVGAGPIEAWLLRFHTSDRRTLYTYRISAAQMVAARNATVVTFRNRKINAESYALDNMRALLDGLNECTADLRQYWNEGRELDGRIASPAEGDVRRLFSETDFPAEAMAKRQEGNSRLLLLIDTNGRVAGCHVLETSGIPIFDVRGCQVVMEHAKFKPATDRSGKPVRSMFTTPIISWRIG